MLPPKYHLVMQVMEILVILWVFLYLESKKPQSVFKTFTHLLLKRSFIHKCHKQIMQNGSIFPCLLRNLFWSLNSEQALMYGFNYAIVQLSLLTSASLPLAVPTEWILALNIAPEIKLLFSGLHNIFRPWQILPYMLQTIMN